jgi:hypothetical protein
MDSAVKIAEIEASEFGIASTFFVLHSSPFYNLLEPKTVEAIKKIKGLGHEIGFHYDCSLFDKVEDKHRLFYQMIGMLEDLCGYNITSIACHNPSHTKDDYFGDTSKLNAYAPAFTKDMCYVSDSVATWRKSALDNILVSPKPKVQLCLHPLYWNREKYCGRKQILDGFMAQRIASMQQEFGEWKDVWDTYLVENEGTLEIE